jgi:EAL domain-containing protein (putative c-di-GMP-specific phosphodiesterase class I)
MTIHRDPLFAVMASGLQKALTNQELELHYQPEVDARTGRVIAVEALLRWHHPMRGLVSPAEFIPLAEQTGLIVPIGDWVLRTACAQAASWRRSKLSPVRVAVNLSARQFEDADFVARVEDALEESGLEPTALELEITESMVARDTAQAAKWLADLRALGVRVVVDDFGTGYSSLNYLKRLPLDTLKIDRSFVSGLGAEPHDSSIVTAVVALADALGLETLAEGVETPEHLAMLRDLGCHMAQGYYFSRPVAAEAVTALLEASPRW